MAEDGVAKLQEELAAERAKVVMAAEAGQMLVVKMQALEQQLESKAQEAVAMQTELNKLRDEVERFEAWSDEPRNAETPRSTRSRSQSALAATAELESALEQQGHAMAQREDELDRKQRVAFKLEEERDHALDQASALSATAKRLESEKEGLEESLEEAREQSLAESTRHQADIEAWQKKRTHLEKQLESLSQARDASETDRKGFEQDQNDLEKRLAGAEASAKRERAEVAALRGELGSLKEQVAFGNEEGSHMQKMVAAVTREKSRLQAACDLLKEELEELKDDNAVLQEQITFLGASAMDHESIQTPSSTSSLFAQLSEELTTKDPFAELDTQEDSSRQPIQQEHQSHTSIATGQENKPAQESAANADDDDAAAVVPETAAGGPANGEAPQFIRPWQAATQPRKKIKMLKRRGHRDKIASRLPLTRLEEDDSEVGEDEMRQRASLRLLKIHDLEAKVGELEKELHDRPVQDAAREYYHMTMTAINLARLEDGKGMVPHHHTEALWKEIEKQEVPVHIWHDWVKARSDDYTLRESEEESMLSACLNTALQHDPRTDCPRFEM